MQLYLTGIGIRGSYNIDADVEYLIVEPEVGDPGFILQAQFFGAAF